MSTDWDVIGEIFSAALEALPDDRQALIDRLCAGRPALRDEVMSLVEAHLSSPEFLRLPPPLELVPPVQPIGVGTTLGAYCLVEEIGHGGMGTVFLAERTDGAFAHRVAVKVMRAAVTDQHAARRFQVERQILASLHHPGIVTLIDGGTAPDGQAYFVMEHVEGRPLSQWLREEQASLEERLRLFRRLCSAVHLAHQHGIVHRDLKPANILVTADGVPKVLDFGVAKLLERAGSDLTLTSLVPGPLTPNYASPEQLRGLDVTTASDVYSLGVLLYECLAGARPYETTGRPVDEVLKQVLDAVPGRPSAVAARGAREAVDGSLPYPAHRLRGDLDAIVLKAMHLDPSQRYASAEELSDDLARWLGGKPVVAREPSLAYVLRKAAARHKAAAAAIVIAVAGVLAAFGVALWQRQVAVRERAVAEQRFDDARRLAASLVFKVHDAVAPLPGSTEVRKLIVTEALTYLDRLAASSPNPAVRMELALAYKKVGRVQGDPQVANLGDREAALASFRRAIDILAPLRDSPALGAMALYETSQLSSLVASVLRVMDRTDEARAASRDALATAEAALANNPGDEATRRLVASGHFSLAMSEADRPAMFRHWLEAERAFEALLAEKPDDADRMRNVALVNKYLGGHLQVDGNRAEAEQRYRRAMELDERRFTLAPDDRQVRFDLAIDLANLGSALAQTGQPEEALKLYERSVAMREALVDADRKDVLARVTLARALTAVARLRYDIGDRPGAARDARRAVSLGPDTPSAGDAAGQRVIGRALIVLATLDADRGRQATACERYRLALAHATRDQLTASDPNDRFWLERLESRLPGCVGPSVRGAGAS